MAEFMRSDCGGRMKRENGGIKQSKEMGTTGAISSRLFELQNEYGDGVRFSVVNLDGLSSDAQRRSRELSEVRYDLIGAHFLATELRQKNSSDLNQGLHRQHTAHIYVGWRAL